VGDSPELVTELVRLAVELAWFFDSCDESVLGDNLAVQWLESIGHTFQRCLRPIVSGLSWWWMRSWRTCQSSDGWRLLINCREGRSCSLEEALA
jgi:hypothetical protein